MNKVLILGAGLVAKPIIEHLLENGYKVLVASPMKERADEMINRHPNGSSLLWSMEEPGILEKLIGENDITVSLLPFKFHTDVAKICVKKKRPLVTTSYVKPEMQELHNEAKEAGVILLNEMGLDPGIDHMSAMRVIDTVHGKNGKIEEFYSLCGALPAPEAADNPFRYKFTWSPKGVILAGKNSALYLKHGNRIFIEPDDLFKDYFIHFVPGIGELEVYPNRDSISYIDIYGIREARTMYRGTLRYNGWCNIIDAIKSLDLLDETIKDFSGLTYSGFLGNQTGFGKANLRQKIASRFSAEQGSAIVGILEWLGFFNEHKLPYSETSSFEIVSDRMIERMPLADNERDMVVMQHLFLASYPDGKKEVIRSSMSDFGTPATNTAIARTVALPAAIAVKLILANKIDLKGVYRPVLPEIYNPVLEELKSLGISMKEEFGLPEYEMIQ